MRPAARHGGSVRLVSIPRTNHVERNHARSLALHDAIGSCILKLPLPAEIGEPRVYAGSRSPAWYARGASFALFLHDMVNINRILCPVDLSEFSRDALHHALALAEWYHAQITVLHVYSAVQPLVPVRGLVESVALPPPVRPDEIAEEVRRFCVSTLGDPGQSIEVVVRDGNATKEIVLLAEELLADCSCWALTGGVASNVCFSVPSLKKCFVVRASR